MGLFSMASISQEYEVNPWPDKLQLKLCHMTTDDGNAFCSCCIERLFKSGADNFIVTGQEKEKHRNAKCSLKRM
jgi:hypothetical protein